MTETKADGGTRSINIQHEIDVVPEIVCKRSLTQTKSVAGSPYSGGGSQSGRPHMALVGTWL